MMVQKPAAESCGSPAVSYSSGSPRSWENSWQNTPGSPSSGSCVYGKTQMPLPCGPWPSVPGTIMPGMSPGPPLGSCMMPEECGQRASEPWTPPPALSPLPAVMMIRWSMYPSGCAKSSPVRPYWFSWS